LKEKKENGGSGFKIDSVTSCERPGVSLNGITHLAGLLVESHQSSYFHKVKSKKEPTRKYHSNQTGLPS
jgi:hypothetical protein